MQTITNAERLKANTEGRRIGFVWQTTALPGRWLALVMVGYNPVGPHLDDTASREEAVQAIEAAHPDLAGRVFELRQK